MDKKLSLFKIAVPIFLEILLFMFLGVADTFMLSRFGSLETSKIAVDAVGMSTQVINNVNIFFSFVSAGTAVLIAQNLGAKNYREIRRVSAVSLGLNLIMGLIFSILIISKGAVMLSLLGVSGERLEVGTMYLQVVGGFMMFHALLTTISAIIRSHGDTHITLKVTIGMNILNVIGDAVFIFGWLGAPKLGAVGVAVATTGSRAIAFVVLTVILFKKYIKLKDLKLLFLKPIEEVKQLLKIGVPSALESMSFNIMQTTIAAMLIKFMPAHEFTTRIYCLQLAWFVLIIGLAIGQATQIMVGQYVGAGDFDMADRVCMKNFRVSLVITVALSFVFYFFGGQLVGLYTTDPNIIRLGASVMMVSAFLEPGRTFNLVIIHGLRGAGDVIFPVVAAIIFMWSFGVVLAYILSVKLGLGLVGIWICLALDEWTRGFIMLFRWKSKKWHTKVAVKAAA